MIRRKCVALNIFINKMKELKFSAQRENNEAKNQEVIDPISKSKSWFLGGKN